MRTGMRLESEEVQTELTFSHCSFHHTYEDLENIQIFEVFKSKVLNDLIGCNF